MTDPQTPDWVRDAVFYQIFPDRFARSLSAKPSPALDAWGAPPTAQGYQGGDLDGVGERLDYLQTLGINAIYFTPVFQSASNHRYHTHDYEKVDPMLGGNAALRRLLDQAHDRGIRVVLDGVFNHASRGFFQFHDILENGMSSPYLDWFTVRGFPLHAYTEGQVHSYDSWWNLPALPKFNIKSPSVREFLLGVARQWIEFGIDGWRLDVANEITDDEFWREFRHTVRDANPEAYIVGEVWAEAQRWLQGDMWDAVMNYLFTRLCVGFFIGEEVDRVELNRTAMSATRTLDAPAFAREVDRLQCLYHPNVTAVMLNLLDSHDMARFLSLARGDRSALELATLFQMTYPGAPSIYYGDEIGMEGKHDPDNRRAFPWDEGETWDRSLLNQFQRLIALRHESTALRRGSYRSLLADAQVHVHERRHGAETVIVALNAGRSTRRVDIPTDLPDQSRLDEVWNQKTSLPVERSTLHQVELAPRSGRIFRQLSPAAPR